MKGGGASKKRLQVSRFKLDALLDLTLSINANIPAAELLSKYESILRDNLKIGKILIFKRSPAWEPILNAGFPQDLLTGVDVGRDLMPFTDIAYVTDNSRFPGVDIIIPVNNNNVLQAFVLIGDIEEEGELVSPVIKHLRFIQTLSGIIVVAIENIRLFNESLKQEALKKELELAARMQQMLIPEDLQMPQGDLISARGFYFPHYEVGGDYYDCIRLSPHKTGICIADVSGKGMPAALLMSNFQASLRALFTHDISLVNLV
ncbi:MAG: SpoIIE family protein phosphatase, partial [Bacteroidales bacterium]|nr:SpoIIE family protein phosphatase [Bacteroidales bacterium]